MYRYHNDFEYGTLGGAFHGVEIVPLFNISDADIPLAFAPANTILPPALRAVGKQLITYWTNFAIYGDPNDPGTSSSHNGNWTVTGLHFLGLPEWRQNDPDNFILITANNTTEGTALRGPLCDTVLAPFLFFLPDFGQ